MATVDMTIDQAAYEGLHQNDAQLDTIAATLAVAGNKDNTDPLSLTLDHVKKADGTSIVLNNAQVHSLDTAALYAITRETQKIENEDQLIPTPKNKQNEVVKGAIDNMKRQ